MTLILLAALVLVQAVAGAYVWRVIAGVRQMSWLGIAGIGLAFGTALSVLAGCLGFLFFPIGSVARTWIWLAPSVAVAIWWVWRRNRGLVLERVDGASLGEGVGALAGVALGMVLFLGNLVNYPLGGSAPWTRYHQDMVFFEGLSWGTSRFSPFDSIFMAGEEIRYHWLTYAWVGQLSDSVDAEPFLVLTRVLPLVALVGTVLIAVAWARTLSPVRWVPTLAAGLIVTGGYAGAIYGAILNFDSPSQALTTMWLLALLVGLLVALRGGALLPWVLFSLVLGVAVAGGKFSTIVVAAGGFGLLTLVGLVRGEPWRWRALMLSGVGLLSIAIMFLWMVSGSSQAGGLGVWSLMDRASSVQGLNLGTSAVGVIAGTALLIVAMSARWSGLAWLAADRQTRGAPEVVMGIGLVLVSVATIALVSGGFNDMWFALAASAPLAVLSAVGVGAFAARLQADSGDEAGRRLLVVAALLAGVSAVVVAVLWGTGAASVGGIRWAGPLVGLGLAAGFGVALGWRARSTGMRWSVAAFGFTLLIAAVMAAVSRPLYLAAERTLQPQVAPFDFELFEPVFPFVEALDTENLTVVTVGQRDAGDFIRGVVQPTDLIATNVTNSPLVAALTGVRTYVSGIHYQAPYGRPAELENVLEREQESWRFIGEPSTDSIKPLCEARIQWVWVSLPKTDVRDWEPWGRIAFSSDDVAVLELDVDQCEVAAGSVEVS